MSENNLKKDVREFYDQVGWQRIEGEQYQNARYEDLRPVSAEYIHRCHMRINRHLAPEGRYLLDAGSGPVQYPEYVTYSEGYHARVCMDISLVALKEARKRLGGHGLYVVGDVAHLPFKSDAFDGIVSLHTIHHVPVEDKIPAYYELYRTLNPGKSMAVVNGWNQPPLMEALKPFMVFMEKLHGWWRRNFKDEEPSPTNDVSKAVYPNENKKKPSGTFVKQLNAEWLMDALDGKMDYEIFVWRSVSVKFLRTVIYPEWGGRFWLKVLYWLEEQMPGVLGRVGQYPLVVIKKPAGDDAGLGKPTEV